jgi:hypothetical protein
MIMVKEEHGKSSRTYTKLTSFDLKRNILESMALITAILECHIPDK